MATERTLDLCTHKKMFERVEQSVTVVIESKFQTGLPKSVFSLANRSLEKLNSFANLMISDLIGKRDAWHSGRFVDASAKKKHSTCFPGKEILFVFFTPHAIAVVKPENGQKHTTRDARRSVCTKWRIIYLL